LTKGVIRRENVSFALNTIIPITQDDDFVYENPA
jgi:hypothetical protein